MAADMRLQMVIDGFTREELERGIKVVYQDEYDELCEVARELADSLALVMLANTACYCDDQRPHCNNCRARQAISEFEGVG